MRPTTALILLAALAGCGGSGPNNNAAGPAGNAPAAPAPVSNATEADAGAALGLSRFREDSLRGCIGGAREAAPAGTPVERQCACAVDRVMAGRTLAQLEAEERDGSHDARFQGLLRTCIAEIAG